VEWPRWVAELWKPNKSPAARFTSGTNNEGVRDPKVKSDKAPDAFREADGEFLGRQCPKKLSAGR